MHEDLSRKVEIKLSTDRTFGLVFAAFFAVVGLFPLLRGGNVRVWALAVSGVFLLTAAVMPGALHPLNLAAAKFAAVMHRFVSPLVSGLFFFVMLTPIAMLSRVFRKDPLRLKFVPDADSYWIPKEKSGPAAETMRNQF